MLLEVPLIQEEQWIQVSYIDPIAEYSEYLEKAISLEISRSEFLATIQEFQDTMDLTKCKDSHPLLSHHLVMKGFMVQMDQHLLAQLVVVEYQEFCICYIARYLVKMEKVET